MSNKKRVCCLYRVSTMGQVDKELGDVPMQRNTCREFIRTRPDWELHEEFCEKGVSGFKVSAKDRDAILKLQEMALNEEFDVLLVFMFDRIGRRDDETPFVVQWFVEHGIEVWSVKEGQQRFENHVDKLLNYIYYWQASGESIKTSIRVKSHMAEEVMRGHYKGGPPPYGYKLVHLGRRNKRGREVYDLAIDETEAPVVVYIFDLYVKHGLGTQLIANRLEAKGILNRKGENFTCATIKNMIHNEMYRGVMRCGEVKTEPFEHLRIIDDETFFRAQEIAEQRSVAYQEKRRIPRKVSKNCLLTGNIFCKECGGRLVTSTTARKKKQEDGSVAVHRVWRYACYNRMRHRSRCGGQSAYTAERVDNAVSEAVRALLGRIKAVPREEIVSARCERDLAEKRTKVKAQRKTIARKERALDTLKQEIASSLTGESSFSPELLSEQIQRTHDDIESMREHLIELEQALDFDQSVVDKLDSDHARLVGYAEMFDACDLDQKRMIICNLVDEIRVARGYQIELKLSFTLEQYLQRIDKPSIEEEGCRVAIADEERRPEYD